MENYNQIFDGMTVQKIEDTIGYRFENRGLLVQAFTRSSFHNEHPAYPDNEVLELIGDSVLSLSVLTYFKNTYTKLGERGLLTDWNEGKLSALKNDLVNKKQLAARMKQMGLHRYLLLSRGDAASGICEEDSVQEDLFESILGAVYVDSGMRFEVAFDVAQTMLDMRLLVEKSAEKVHISCRNDLQEWCEDKKRKFKKPEYQVQQFADDDFLTTVRIPEIGLEAQGRGKNTKYACESAAKALLERLEKYGEDAFFADEVKQENFVGRLQEKLQALGDGSVAAYDLDAADELLANGEHLFTVSCQCLGRCTYGKGSSKKAAKQKAAEEMLKVLKFI